MGKYKEEIRKGKIKLLNIKDSQIRMITLEQAFNAVDKGIHIGGCFSSTIPMVCLFYGGIINIDVKNPTEAGQDIFVLSKGHSIALMASIYCDLGYFDSSVLKKSRSFSSILNGHPGPSLPGVHVSTGPLGQGISVAAGFSLIGKADYEYDVYSIVGDGELQEGILWEPVMYAAYKKLDNFCVIIDRNRGQLDDVKNNVIDMGDIKAKFEAFGWNVLEVDGTQIKTVYNALDSFKTGERNGRPTAIICNTYKGYGGFSSLMSKHKINLTEMVYHQEYNLQKNRYEKRVEEFKEWFEKQESDELKQALIETAKKMNFEININDRSININCIKPSVKLRPAKIKDKRINYKIDLLPEIDSNKEYSASDIIEKAMKVFAVDKRVVSIDSDLSSASGLMAGISSVDRERALNAGIAEANMMSMGEAFAVCGYNVWVSTFCPFFDWKVLRRIAVGYQERLEAIKEKTWLSEGHGLDMTFLATAANLDTRENGATHMGNDDIMVFDEIAHLKIIDVSCPRQLLSIMKWIMGGNKGPVYLRVMRAPSGVLYDGEYEFDYQKGFYIMERQDAEAVVISSGREVHEAVEAANILIDKGIAISVVDMPSIDSKMLRELYNKTKIMFFAEQNNGYIYKNFIKIMFASGSMVDTGRIIPVNLLVEGGDRQFIHSGTMQELTDGYGLSGQMLAAKIEKILNER
ncbi:MAG: transketolase [Ruminiclostridium sp.]|nr:transketolase [Ruminiclostridium sp.]